MRPLAVALLWSAAALAQGKSDEHDPEPQGVPSAEGHIRWVRGEATTQEQRVILDAFDALATERSTEVLACFESYLKTRPFPEPLVAVVEAQVDPLGRIIEVRDVVRDVAPRLQTHGELVGCVVDSLLWRKLPRPPPSGTVLIEVEYLFTVR